MDDSSISQLQHLFGRSMGDANAQAAVDILAGFLGGGNGGGGGDGSATLPPPGSGTGLLQYTKMPLNNDQIIAASAAPFVLIPPSAVFDRLFVPIQVIFLMQNSAGAYTNTATPMSLDLYWGTGGGLYLGSPTQFVGGALQQFDVSPMFWQAKRKCFASVSINSANLANADEGNLGDNALCFIINNGSNGALTGGNDANILDVRIYSTELDFGG